jgi:peptide/nickel transport system substrate-binding protein
MRTRKRHVRLVALLAAGSLIAAACGDDDDGGSDDPTTTASVDVPEGGTLVVGMEQQPDCMAWIKSCSGASWGYWTVNVNTMPRAYDTVLEGDIWVATPSELLTGEPELNLDDPEKPVVTYSLNPDAVWDDGTNITCADFEFTWDSIANGDDIYDPTGYTDIESVDCSGGDQTVVVNFAKVYSGWKQLFGGGYGILPSHVLEGKDIQAEMGDGYTFSGGPWKLKAWNKDVEIILEPNENYWGSEGPPKLDEVVFRLQEDTSAGFQAFTANEVSVLYHRRCPVRVLGQHREPRGAVDQQRCGSVRRRGSAPGVCLLDRP